MSLASDAGLDTKNCELCLKPLDNKKPWVRGLDGMGAHRACLKREGVNSSLPDQPSGG